MRLWRWDWVTGYSKSSLIEPCIAHQDCYIINNNQSFQYYFLKECPAVSKIAFVFPGQGSQYAGMGRGLAEKYPAARQVFDDADAALGFSISELCFNGPAEELKLTAN